MTQEEFEFPLAGTLLKGKAYLPEQVRALVVLVHGMGEYAARYERFVIPYLVRQGCAVYAYDQFGHGSTKGKRGHHPGYDHLLDAVAQAMSLARENWPKKPLFLYGHSMGGNIVINYVLDRAKLPDGVIATSPFLRLAFDPPGWKLFLGKVVQKLMPSYTMASELDTNALSRDAEEVAAYEQDPMIHDRVSPAYSLELMERGEWALMEAGNLKVPLFLAHGTADRITDHLASEEFKQVAGENVSLHLMEGGFHELHHDLAKEALLKKITNWMDKQITKP